VIALLAVLTWMGSPAYKVSAPPAEEIALEFVPFDRHGEIHEVPWDQLLDGTYDTASSTEGNLPNAKRLKAFMVDLQDAMRKEKDLPENVATLTITTWQRDLKRVDLDFLWEEGGKEFTFNQHTYIHKATTH